MGYALYQMLQLLHLDMGAHICVLDLRIYVAENSDMLCFWTPYL